MGILVSIVIAIVAAIVITLTNIDGITAQDTMKTIEMKKHNRPIRCDCGIVSRQYQLQGEVLNCPHCGISLLLGLYDRMVEDSREFPFAPKLTDESFENLMRLENEKKSIKKEMDDLIAYDKEVEAWEKIQTKKIEKEMGRKL